MLPNSLFVSTEPKAVADDASKDADVLTSLASVSRASVGVMPDCFISSW